MSWEKSKPFWRYQNFPSRKEDVHVHSRPFMDKVLSEERQLMKLVGIFQVGIFPGGIFLEPIKTLLWWIPDELVAMNTIFLNYMVSYAISKKKNSVLDFKWSFKLGLNETTYIASKLFLVLVCSEAFAKIVQLQFCWMILLKCFPGSELWVELWCYHIMVWFNNIVFLQEHDP